jgi:hypothetical protein
VVFDGSHSTLGSHRLKEIEKRKNELTDQALAEIQKL